MGGGRAGTAEEPNITTTVLDDDTAIGLAGPNVPILVRTIANVGGGKAGTAHKVHAAHPPETLARDSREATAATHCLTRVAARLTATRLVLGTTPREPATSGTLGARVGRLL